MYLSKNFNFPFVPAPAAGLFDWFATAPTVEEFTDCIGVSTGWGSVANTTTTATMAAGSGTDSGSWVLTSNNVAGSAFFKSSSCIRYSANKPCLIFARIKNDGNATSFGFGGTPVSGNLFSGAWTGPAMWINGTDLRYGVAATAGTIGTSTTTSTGVTVAANEYVSLAILWTGSVYQFFANGLKVGESTTACTGVDCYIAVIEQNSTTVTSTTIDYLGLYATR